MEEILNQLAKMQKGIDNISDGLNIMQQDIVNIQHDIFNLKQEVSDVKQEVSDVKQEVSDVKQDLIHTKQELKQEIREVREEVKELSEQVEITRNNLLVVEFEHGKKIDALFDLIKLEQHMNSQEFKTLHTLENRTQINEFHICNHEDRISFLEKGTG